MMKILTAKKSVPDTIAVLSQRFHNGKLLYVVRKTILCAEIVWAGQTQ